MRILLVSDLHYALPQLDWVVAAAGDYDLVVVAGDLLDISSIVQPDAQIAVAVEYLSRIAKKTAVVACSGNHDLNTRNEFDERAADWLDAARAAGAVVDGARLEDDHMVVTVCPWWDGPQTKDVLAAQLATDAGIVGDRTWLWAYHGPPDDSPTSWTGSRHYGDAELNAWIDEHHPDLVLCGHVHQSPFVADGSWIDHLGTTTVCNAGRQPGPVPTFVEIDTALGLARWTSYEGVDEQALAAS
ncbi:MAG: metallophosphoesterase [Acidimicrobiia bacterium]